MTIKETIDNFKNVDPVAVTTPTTVDALEVDKKVQKETDELINPMVRKKVKPFLGAEKQPLPKEVELPKVELDESLFEDVNLTERKTKETKTLDLYDLIYDELESENFAYRYIQVKGPGYTADKLYVTPDGYIGVRTAGEADLQHAINVANFYKIPYEGPVEDKYSKTRDSEGKRVNKYDLIIKVLPDEKEVTVPYRSNEDSKEYLRKKDK